MAGRLVRLEVENFKSYGGRQIIGPFDDNFVAIIGPNGAGKSNLMDALSFVLGISSLHLRSAQLAELIHRRGGVGEQDGSTMVDGDVAPSQVKRQSRRDTNNPTFAMVAAHYRRVDGSERIFSRKITSSGHSEYRIDGRVMTFSEYARVWEGENVLIKARNFLVFQGDVEAIASKSPKELARLLEQISGSEEYRIEYERRKEALDQAIEQSALTFNKKRGLASELRLVQEQREDVVRFEKLETERTSLQTEYHLWKLFHIEENAKGLATRLNEKGERLAEIEGEAKQAEVAWKEARKDHAKIQKDVLAAERRSRKAQVELDAEAPQALEVEERMRFARQKMVAVQENRKRAEKDLQQYEMQVSAAEREIEQVQKSASRFEQISEQQLKSVEISPELLKEYTALRAVVAERAAKERLRLETIERQTAPQVASRKQLEAKLVELETARKRLDSEIAVHLSKQAEMNANQEGLEMEIATVQREIGASLAKRTKMEQLKAEISEKLRDILSRLLQAKVDRQESEKELRFRSNVESLKRIFPGVHGSMVDLCRPTHRRYEQALAVTLGKNIDAIVVDHEKTAIACIQYLCEQRAGQAIFIPLDTIQVPSNNTANRAFGEGVRPALEAMRFDDIYLKAFQYACGNAVVCDNLSIARNICYERGIRIKAVTLDGTVIHKSGLMTGGVHGQPTRRWEEREVVSLKSERDQCLATLADLEKSLRRHDVEERMRAQLVELEARRAYLQEELSLQERKLQGMQEELMHVDQECHRCRVQRDQIREEMRRDEEEAAALMGSIGVVEDKVFATFCATIGFANIREFEASRVAASKKIHEQRAQFSAIISKLEHQILFLRQQSHDAHSRLTEYADRLAELDRELFNLNTQAQQVMSKVEKKRTSLSSAQRELEEAKTALARHEQLVGERRKAAGQTQSALASIAKDIASSECEIERLLGQRDSLLRLCRLQEIDLPLLQGAVFREINLDREGGKGAILIDFSSLSRQARTHGEAAMEHKYQEKLNHLMDEMDKLMPNLRSLEKINNAEGRLKETMESFERTRNELKKAKDDFASIKHQRSTRFNQAFKAISSKIDGIYKELTRSDVVPTGGTAFLSLENSEEPYLEGIRYHAMPPMKRFLDMDQLSGGEKTVAALALLFAIHTFRPAPFFILDEIDAALDGANVQRVAQFICARAAGHSLPQPAHPPTTNPNNNSSQDSPQSVTATNTVTQFLVISLKSTLYERADALVGIYRDPSKRASQVLTMRLADYPN